MDKVSPEKRSWTMAQVKGKNTRPERLVRSILHRIGFRFRLHDAKLPGKPDIVLPKHRAVVFVHGCFWHRHPGCFRASTPTGNAAYWSGKFSRTMMRDAKNKALLESLGWRVFIVWECELRDAQDLSARLSSQIRGPGR